MELARSSARELIRSSSASPERVSRAILTRPSDPNGSVLSSFFRSRERSNRLENPDTELADRGALGADLEQQSRFHERPVAPQVALVQHPKPARDRTIEGADSLDVLHYLTLVRDIAAGKSLPY
jgi:hypothetical protein